MLILLNHAGPLEGSLEANYELYQGPSATYDTTPNNTNNILNTSNDMYNSEDNNIKRTLISPYISRDEIKVKGNNKNLDDNFSNN